MTALLAPLQFAILPIFAIMAVGYAVGLSGAMDRAAAPVINRFVMLCPLPALLVLLLARVETAALDWGALGGYCAGVFATYAAGYAAARFLFRRTGPEALLIGAGAAFSNHVFYVLPIAESLYGPDVRPAIGAMIAADTITIFVGSIVALEVMRAGAAGAATVPLKIARNPVILAIAAGIAINLSGVGLHDGVALFLDTAAAAAAPASLFALGLILSGVTLRSDWGPAAAMTAVKIAFNPLMVFVILRPDAEGLSFETLALLVAAAPCGAMPFVMALRYDVRTDDIARAIVLSSVLSLATLAILA